MSCVRSPYVVRVYHKSKEVFAAVYACRDQKHALQMAAYVILAAARDAAPPAELTAPAANVNLPTVAV